MAEHWVRWISNLINQQGNAYFVTFMFHQLPGKGEDQLEMVIKNIEKVYFRLLMSCEMGAIPLIHKN